jgi:hypothetical protein
VNPNYMRSQLDRWLFEFFKVKGTRKYRVCRKLPATTPIFATSTREQANPILFRNILTPILNDSGEKTHPVPEDALHVIRSEAIPHICNRHLDFLIRGKLAIL